VPSRHGIRRGFEALVSHSRILILGICAWGTAGAVHAGAAAMPPVLATAGGASALRAHPFHVTTAEVDLNEETGHLEWALKLWPLDLEAALRLREKRRVHLDDETHLEDLASALLSEQLRFHDAQGKELPISWYGMDLTLAEVWLYFEVPVPEGIDGLEIDHHLFRELYEQQENTVLLRAGGRSTSLVFRKGRWVQRLGTASFDAASSEGEEAPRNEESPATTSPARADIENDARSAVEASREPTFHQDVERVLQRRCLRCHHIGGAGPFSLQSFEEVRGFAPMIGEVVAERRMPPWFADRSIGHFRNDPSLPQEEIDLILRWIEAGAPQGDPGKAPPPLLFDPDFGIGKPDVVYSLDPFPVAAEELLPYRYVRLKTSFPQDLWISAAQIRSSSPEVVHHVLVFINELGSRGESRPYTPPIDRNGLLRDIPEEMRAEVMPRLTAYSWDYQQALGGGLFGYLFAGEPDHSPIYFPEESARLLPAGAVLIFQIHYTPDGEEKESVTELAMKLSDVPPRSVLDVRAVPWLALAIPPFEPNYVQTARYKLPRSATLISLRPHMHLRGKSFRFVARHTDGTEETLLHVPRFDFNWQLDYVLEPPRLLEKDSILEVTATYDNSADNLNNPDPSRKVYFGIQSEEEMLIGYFQCIWHPDER